LRIGQYVWFLLSVPSDRDSEDTKILMVRQAASLPVNLESADSGIGSLKDKFSSQGRWDQWQRVWILVDSALLLASDGFPKLYKIWFGPNSSEDFTLYCKCEQW
jgi:hypothetical protein